MVFVATLFALLVGLSLGLLGGGGSILTVPILRYVLGMEAHAAIAMSLLVVGTTSAAGLVAHARQGRVQWRTGLSFGGAGMLGAFAAGRVAHLVPAAFLLIGFGVMMFATAIAMLRSDSNPSERRAARRRDGAARLPMLEVLLEGLAVGAVTGFVGAGGGFLVVPALVLLGGLPMDVAVGTSLLVIALKSFAGFAGFLGHTELDWKLAALIGGAAVVGSFGGALLASRVSPRALRQGFGWFVVAMACFISLQELPPLIGRAWHPAVSLVAALVATSLIFAARRIVAKLAGATKGERSRQRSWRWLGARRAGARSDCSVWPSGAPSNDARP